MSIPPSLSHDERLRRADEQIERGMELLDRVKDNELRRELDRIQTEAKYGARADPKYINDQ